MTERKVSSERVSEELSALDKLLSYGRRESDGRNEGTLFLFADNRHFFWSDPDVLALRSSVKTEIRIKSLEWERVTESPAFHGDEKKRFWKAANPFGGSYWINVHTEDFEGEASWGGKKYPNSAAAMNAVEDHLRACVLSAIEAPAAEGEVTESMVQKAWEAYDAKSGYSKPERFRAALTAALKGGK